MIDNSIPMERMIRSGVCFLPVSAFDPNLTLHNNGRAQSRTCVIGLMATSIEQMAKLHLPNLSTKRSKVRFKMYV